MIGGARDLTSVRCWFAVVSELGSCLFRSSTKLEFWVRSTRENFLGLLPDAAHESGRNRTLKMERIVKKQRLFNNGTVRIETFVL